MKKLIVLMLAMFCMFSMGVAAGDGDGTETQDVLYTVNEGYTWSIHSAIDFASSLEVEDQAITVTNSVLAPNHKIAISIDAYSCASQASTVPITNHAFQVANAINTSIQLAYAVTDANNNPVAIDGVVLEVLPAEAGGEATLNFTLDTTQDAAGNLLPSQFAGDYFGKLVYTSAIIVNN